MPLTFYDWPMVLPLLALVLARVSGLFLTAPVFSSSTIPIRIKVYAAMAVALVVLPNLLATPVAVAGWIDLLAGMAAELALGAIFGFFLNLMFVGLQIGAQLASQQCGIAMAEVFNPGADIEVDVLGNIYYWVVTIAFFALGGHRMLVRSLLDTFVWLPPLGVAWPDSVTGLLVSAVAACFELALRLAWPVLLALLLTELAMGFVSRTMPQLNILAVGFPLRILVGLAVVLLTIEMAATMSLQMGDGLLQSMRDLWGGLTAGLGT